MVCAVVPMILASIYVAKCPYLCQMGGEQAAGVLASGLKREQKERAGETGVATKKLV